MEYYKAYKGTHYEVVAPSGDYGLQVHHDDSIEGVKEDIDRSNERAVRQGYQPSTWTIVKVEWVTYRDKDDHLVARERREYAVETYPAI